MTLEDLKSGIKDLKTDLFKVNLEADSLDIEAREIRAKLFRIQFKQKEVFNKKTRISNDIAKTRAQIVNLILEDES